MSLSFVSKAIQTTRDDGGYDEKPVESKNDGGGRSSVTGDHRPLFDQLRANKEREEEERAEFQRSIMRGTLALDEEDAAHLDALNKRNMEEKAKRKQETQQELAAFRAAKADRLESNVLVAEPAPQLEVSKVWGSKTETQKRPAKSIPVARIVVKKRRKNGTSNETSEKEGSIDTSNQVCTETDGEAKEPTIAEKPSLGGLLSGYGSSDEED